MELKKMTKKDLAKRLTCLVLVVIMIALSFVNIISFFAESREVSDEDTISQVSDADETDKTAQINNTAETNNTIEPNDAKAENGNGNTQENQNNTVESEGVGETNANSAENGAGSNDGRENNENAENRGIEETGENQGKGKNYNNEDNVENEQNNGNQEDNQNNGNGENAQKDESQGSSESSSKNENPETSKTDSSNSVQQNSNSELNNKDNTNLNEKGSIDSNNETSQTAKSNKDDSNDNLENGIIKGDITQLPGLRNLLQVTNNAPQANLMQNAGNTATNYSALQDLNNSIKSTTKENIEELQRNGEYKTKNDAYEIRTFATQFLSGASKDENNNLVWTATTTAKGHEFTFRVNYALSGYGQLPAGSVQITIPK